MQLTIYGNVAAGRVTINADGIRVTLQKRDDGQWLPSSQDSLKMLRTIVPPALGPVLRSLLEEEDVPSQVKPVSS